MSLLLNEDFTLYNLRLGYLNNIHDGVGERLIALNPAVLSDPAFRAAGWTPDVAATKRCYSPPIPTTGAAEYFTRPARSRQGFTLADNETPEEGAGGMISGHRGSEETLGPTALTERERRRRKQREKMEEEEEDDSSELSDDSDDEDTAAQGVRFAKMPNRRKSSVSPRRDDKLKAAGPEVNVISPSFRPRTSSLGATEALRQVRAGRPRADTVTSSEMSSETESLDPNATFRRKLSGRPQRAAVFAEKIAEECDEDPEAVEDEDDEEEEEDVEVAEASDLSDDFEGDDVAVHSPDFLGAAAGTTSSPPKRELNIPPAVTPSQSVQKKTSKDALPKLPRLPIGQAITTVSAASLITLSLKGNDGVANIEKPFQEYAELSGKGEASPVWIKIYYPFAAQASKPLEVPIRRQKNRTEDGPPSVSDLIGLALYQYEEENREPKLKGGDTKPERWELRMVDDGEVEMDFPALNASRPITDFTSNNNRPPQRRARDRPWDEFGLVRAEAAESDDGEEQPTTSVSQADAAVETRNDITKPVPPQPSAPPPAPPSMAPVRNPITGPSFALAVPITRKDSSNLLDAPAAPTSTSTPRTGAPKTVSIHFTDPQSFQTTVLPIQTTADTYIAEIFDMSCTRLRLDKALYVLKVRGTQTVAPSDRTVEALGANLHLDLVRRRFGAVGDFGLGMSGSPGSSSPNAPLELVPNTPPTGKDPRRRKGFNVPGVLNPLAAQQAKPNDAAAATASTFNFPGAQAGRRYNVLRKQPLSFAASHPRTLVITPEFVQILPAQGGEEGVPATGKVTSIHMSSIVGVKVSRKHPKMVRVLVYKEKETKRYDFETSSPEEAQAIVADVRVGVGEYGGGIGGGED